ncbi:MAG: cell division protein ZapE [Betaproteobacteria bacterium]|nr:cell division protein ZapE [Betaproteobacteria bacterium]
MSDETPPIPHNHHRRFDPERGGSDPAPWIRRHARELGFELDAAQERVLGRFERLYEDLIGLERLEASLVRLLARRRVVRGIYLWGGVGRGKSFLMDSFFNCAPTARKRRVHFHRLMQELHRGLHERRGRADPVAGFARNIARRTRLVCLDEFHVTDITDAMLMRRLLEALFDQGTVLVTTSNFAPDDLYLHGLQRNQFLPAIELIRKNLEVVNVDGGTDYRLRELERAGVYHTEANADERLERAFTGIARHESPDANDLEIEGRPIRVRRQARGAAWFDFHELCDGPRAKADYIELARRYHTILLSGVPRFSGTDADKLRRFVWLVDEFYDRRVKLIVTAAADAADLIDDDGEEDRFQANLNVSLKERLVSRLTEMQTRDYLTQPHLP